MKMLLMWKLACGFGCAPAPANWMRTSSPRRRPWPCRPKWILASWTACLVPACNPLQDKDLSMVLRSTSLWHPQLARQHFQPLLQDNLGKLQRATHGQIDTHTHIYIYINILTYVFVCGMYVHAFIHPYIHLPDPKGCTILLVHTHTYIYRDR